MPTVAVMQPYFVPYAGYYRLFAAADIMVAFDCVQFPRRGWVHRNRLPLASGELDWLTLPVAKAAFDARISEMRFQSNAEQILKQSMQRFPALSLASRTMSLPVMTKLATGLDGDLSSYLTSLNEYIATELHIKRPIVRSSSLPIDPLLRGQQRVLSILAHLGATKYVNSPGGRELYDHSSFHDAGIELFFLDPYRGDTSSILHRLLTEDRRDLAREIVSLTRLEK